MSLLRFPLLLPVLVVSLALPARAGTIRADRPDEDYVSLAASASYAAAGKIEVTGDIPGFIGSGTLVGSSWVLTAAHLLEGANHATFQVGGNTYTADGWIAHPGWKGDARKGNDLALMRLSSPVTNIAPVGLYRTKDEFGQTGVFIGNGRTGTGDSGAITYDAVPRAGTNTIDGMSVGKKKVYTTKLTKSAKIFIVDFDDPLQPGKNVVGSAEPTDLEFLIAQGDSGGAVFLPGPSGQPLIAGIHSYGEAPVGLDDSGYGDVTGHTRVSSYAKWIDKQIKRDRPTFLALPGQAPDPIDRSLSMADLGLGSSTDYAAALAPSPGGSLPEPTAAATLLLTAAACSLRRRRHR